jgi:hypothetical protein
MNGGELILEMGEKPNKSWGRLEDELYSMTKVKTTSIPFLTGDDVSYFTEKSEVGLDCSTPGVEIRYTLDGSEPTQDSKLFTTPFTVSKTTPIKARAFKANMKSGPIMKTIAQKAKFLDPVKVDNLVQGLNYEYYEGKYSSVNDMKDADLLKTGTLNYFNLDEAEREDHYGFIYTGYISIPHDGIYEFYTTSDDGSVLYIDDVELVNNDGSHSAITASNRLALKKGLHKLRLLYFEDYEGNSIEVGYQSDKIKRQILPENTLFRRVK